MTTDVHASPRTDCVLVEGTRFRVWDQEPRVQVSGKPVAHPGFELTWIARGEARYRIGSAHIVAPAGSVVVVPANVEHATTLGGDVRGIALWLDQGTVAQVADAARCARNAVEQLTPGLIQPRNIPQLLSMMEGELADMALGWHMAAETMLEAIVLEMLRVAELRSRRRRILDPRIKAAVDAIETRHAEPLSVDDLAKTACMSRFHFSRLFREQIGVAPYKHLLRVRIARSVALLERGNCSVTEAAIDVGFQDLGRFSRLFREQMGYLPSEIARRSRSSNTARLGERERGTPVSVHGSKQ